MNEINELDRACMEEAERRLCGKDRFAGWRDVAAYAAMLARTGWEPVDEDLIAAREVLADDARRCGFGAWLVAEYLAGKRDTGHLLRHSLAAMKRGRELERASRERGQ